MKKTTKAIEKFVPSTKILAMKDGRTNFATCTPEFLAHAELINKGTGELSDIRAEYSAKLEKAENALNLYLKGSVIDSNEVKRLQATVEKLSEEKASAAKAVREYMPKTTKADENLYSAYFYFQTVPCAEKYNDEFEILYRRAFMEWFDSYGMQMGKKDFAWFSTKLGVKKASNKVYRESGAKTMTTAMGKRQFVELLYLIIIELMVKKGIIKNYEFTYVEETTPAEAPAEAPAEKSEEESLESKTVSQLKDLAKEKGLKVSAKMKKSDIVDLILNA